MNYLSLCQGACYFGFFESLALQDGYISFFLSIFLDVLAGSQASKDLCMSHLLHVKGQVTPCRLTALAV